MAAPVSSKLSHKAYHARLKKQRRKLKRQTLARAREKENEGDGVSDGSPENNEEVERERERLHLLWLQREEEAQKEFIRKQELEEIRRKEREEQLRRMKEEIDNLSLKKATLPDVKSKNTQDGDGPWHNPIAPNNEQREVPRQDVCQFFTKTGACRFGERCSRSHVRPTSSTVIMIRGMFSHFSMEQAMTDDYDADAALEYEESETYQYFEDFYDDVLPEFQKCGRVVQLKVCCNHEPHLRGNVYVQFQTEHEAQEAFKIFNGRFYGGKQLSCEFSSISSWKSAICGLFHKNVCPKGKNCNFLHVFKNPSNEFWGADRDMIPHRGYRSRRSSAHSRRRSPPSHRSPSSPRRSRSHKRKRSTSESRKSKKRKRKHKHSSKKRKRSSHDRSDHSSE